MKDIKLSSQDQSNQQLNYNSTTETPKCNDCVNLDIQKNEDFTIFASLIEECKIKSKLNNLKLDADHLSTLSFVYKACWSDSTVFAIFKGDDISQSESTYLFMFNKHIN